MNEVMRRLASDPIAVGLACGIALVYLVLFEIVVGDLTLHATVHPVDAFVVPDWSALLFRMRAPFQFEAIAVIEAPFAVWLVSPMNLATGFLLGALTGFQIALIRVARHCATACGLNPASGFLAGLPGLLAGSACCAPLIFLLLGVQLTASLVTLMSLMIPAAFILLILGSCLTLRVAARHCSAVTT